MRPELQIDETDRVNIPPTTFGSWTNVKNNCINRTPFVDFFDNNIAGEKLMIVQLDTDVCSEYGVQEVLKTDDPKADSRAMRARVVAKIEEWIGEIYAQKTCYAICVRQLDAWLLPLIPKIDKDTASISKPKEELHRSDLYQKQKFRNISTKYDEISKPFSKEKVLKKCLANNESLKEFVTSLKIVISPEAIIWKPTNKRANLRKIGRNSLQWQRRGSPTCLPNYKNSP